MTRRTLLSAALSALALRSFVGRPSPDTYRDTFHHVQGYAKLTVDQACGSGAWLLVLGNPPYGCEHTP